MLVVMFFAFNFFIPQDLFSNSKHHPGAFYHDFALLPYSLKCGTNSNDSRCVISR